jgi:hypothetical protein
VTEPTNEKILERVRRLLALSKSSNEFEAAAAAAKAQELLFKHRLEMNEVPTEDGKNASEPFERHTMKAENTATWRGTLLNVIAMNNDCSVIRLHGTFDGKKEYAVVGQKSNFEVCEYLYGYLVQQIDAAAKKHYEMGRSDQWFTAFRFGAVNAVGETLKEQRRASAATPTGMELVVASTAALEKKTKELFPHLTTRNQRIGDSGGYQTGQRDGAKIGIRRAMTSTGSARALLG